MDKNNDYHDGDLLKALYKEISKLVKDIITKFSKIFPCYTRTKVVPIYNSIDKIYSDDFDKAFEKEYPNYIPHTPIKIILIESSPEVSPHLRGQ